MDVLLSGKFRHLHFLKYFTSLLLLECMMQKRANVTSHNIQEYSKCLFWKAASFLEASLVMLVVNNWPANAGDAREIVLIPGFWRPSGEGNGIPLQYSCLENPMDRGAWWATVCGVAKSWKWLKLLGMTHLGLWYVFSLFLYMLLENVLISFFYL